MGQMRSKDEYCPLVEGRHNRQGGEHLVSLASLLIVAFSCASCAHLQALSGYTAGSGLDVLALRQPRGKMCAPTCLSAVAKHWGLSWDAEQIAADLGPMPKGGYTLGQLRDWARGNGFQAYLVEGTLEKLGQHTLKGRPIIVAYKVRHRRNHSVVVREVSDGEGISAMDPAKGRTVQMTRPWFLARWRAIGSPMLIIAPAERPSS